MTPPAGPARLLAGVTVLAIVMIGWMGIAGATPALITTVAPGGTATIPGVASPGEFLGTLCGFSPLSPVNFSVVSVKGSAASEGSQIADQAGCVTLDGRVDDGRLSINGSAPAAVGVGVNDVIGSGDSAKNAHVYDTLRVPILRSGASGLLVSRDSNIGDIMAIVVACICGLAVLYLLVTFIRHRMPGGMRTANRTA